MAQSHKRLPCLLECMLTFSSEYVKEYGQGSLFKQQQNAVVTKQIGRESDIAYSPTKVFFSSRDTWEIISDVLHSFVLSNIPSITIVLESISGTLGATEMIPNHWCRSDLFTWPSY